MTKEDFQKKFNTVLIDKVNKRFIEIKPETKFSDFGLNSLDMIEVVIDFENTFFISIPDEDIVKLTTVNDAEEYLKTKLNVI